MVQPPGKAQKKLDSLSLWKYNPVHRLLVLDCWFNLFGPFLATKSSVVASIWSEALGSEDESLKGRFICRLES
jgi:hypothetical protein